MTYNSTLAIVPILRPLIPLRPVEGVRPARCIYVTEDIRDRISHNSKGEGFPAVSSDRLISVFWAGYFINISLLGDPSNQKPDLERLHSVDEVWAICFRRIKQDQWRILGRFSSRNVFVGLGLYRRSELAGRNYEEKAKLVIYEWSVRYGLSEPLRGSTKGDYLGGVVGDVDVD